LKLVQLASENDKHNDFKTVSFCSNAPASPFSTSPPNLLNLA
jgi:hypothetical protein